MLDMIAHAYTPRGPGRQIVTSSRITWATRWVLGHLGLYNKILSQKQGARINKIIVIEKVIASDTQRQPGTFRSGSKFYDFVKQYPQSSFGYLLLHIRFQSVAILNQSHCDHEQMTLISERLSLLTFPSWREGAGLYLEVPM